MSDLPARQSNRIPCPCLSLELLTRHLLDIAFRESFMGLVCGLENTRGRCQPGRIPGQPVVIWPDREAISSLSPHFLASIHYPPRINARCMSAVLEDEPSPGQKRKRAPRALIACETCRSRKLRCDQASPCSHCVRLQQPCNYRSPGIQLPGARIPPSTPDSSSFIARYEHFSVNLRSMASCQCFSIVKVLWP